MDIPDTLPAGQYVIYALVDPTDGLVYYVGQTWRPQKRLAQHLNTRHNHHHQDAKVEWVRHLDEKGQKPLMQVLEQVSGRSVALTREKAWIRHFQEQGMPILNPKKKPWSSSSLQSSHPLPQDSLVLNTGKSQPPSGPENADPLENDERWQREQRILAVAVDLLVRWGYHKTALDDVARVAGVSKNTIYLYWKDKETLFRIVLQREQQQISEDIKRRIAADPAGGLFHHLIVHALLAALSNPLMVAIIKDKKGLYKGLPRADDLGLLNQLVSNSDTYFAQLQQAGLIRTDLSVPIITFLMGALKVGIIHASDLMGQEQMPSTEQLTESLSNLMRRWLEPE